MSKQSARYIIYSIMRSYLNALREKVESWIKLGLGFSKERTRVKVTDGMCKGVIIIKNHRIYAE